MARRSFFPSASRLIDLTGRGGAAEGCEPIAPIDAAAFTSLLPQCDNAGVEVVALRYGCDTRRRRERELPYKYLRAELSRVRSTRRQDNDLVEGVSELD